jgi:hypothetical protein
MDSTFTYRGEEVRVREKVRVESSADPSLLSVMAKLGQLERTVEAARLGLSIVSGVKIGDEDQLCVDGGLSRFEIRTGGVGRGLGST